MIEKDSGVTKTRFTKEVKIAIAIGRSGLYNGAKKKLSEQLFNPIKSEWFSVMMDAVLLIIYFF